MRRIYDTFTDTNAVLLPNHVLDIDLVGGGWIAVAGVWDILSNEAKATAVVQARATVDSGIYDGRFKVNLMVGLATGKAYLIFRLKDADEYWYAGLDDSGQVANLYEMTPGPLAVLRAQAAFAQDEATWYEIKVLCQGDFIEVYIDDVLYLTHTSESLQTETEAGILAPSNSDARFDDFIVDDRPTCLYCTSGDIKGRMGVQWTSGTALDAVLDDLIASASRLIDNELGWPHCYFAAADLADQTRRFDTEAGTEMWIPRCLTITTLWLDTTGNGAVDTQWFRGTDFEVWPYGVYGTDWFNKIIVKEGASRSFPTGQRRLEIVGRFGGYSTPPQKIKEACIITVARWVKRAQQMYQDTGAIVELGQLTYTKALDPDVQEILRVTERRVAIG